MDSQWSDSYSTGVKMNNGPIYNRFAEEYEIWLDGEFITWASDMTTANRLYNQARTTKYEHLKHSQNAWEWQTLITPADEVIEALDRAHNDTEPLQPFKQLNGIDIVCYHCQDEANKQGIPLAYDSAKVSHGICPKHFVIERENLEKWITEQKLIKVP